MERKRKLLVAKMAVAFGAVPILLWAYEYGPDAGYSGVPKENGTCASSQCHVGTANNPANKGSVAVNFPSMTYVPGVKQHLTVTIADPAQHAWGFQLTTRLASNSNTQAGTFASSDANTTMMCAQSSNVAIFHEAPFSPGKAQTCPASETLQYIEHSLTGYTASRGQADSGTYQFDWTPPSTNVGNVTVYVAGNAANGDLTNNFDHIYTTTYTLTPSAGGSTPTISSVQSASAFGGFGACAPGTWIEIYGSNLAPTTYTWAGSDFNGNAAPTNLKNVTVSIGGQAGFVYYISPTQINAQVPSNVGTGTQPVTVTTPSGTSAASNITVNPLQPGLLAPSSFVVGGKPYVVAQVTDSTGTYYVLPAGAIAGVLSRPAKAGETILIYGVGFGPVTDTSNLIIPAGQVVTKLNLLNNPIKMQIGAPPATLSYAGLAPGFVGLYQFNVVVPPVPPSSAVPLTFSLNGAAGSQTLFTAVQ